MKPIVHSPYTIDREPHSLAHSLCCEDPSRTVQADVQQSDINYIVKQFGLTHELPYGVRVPEYDDFTNAPNDYHAAMNYIREANHVFMDMPADIRSRFDNDAGAFLDFVSDGSNYDEAVKFGLVPPKPVPPVDGVSAPLSPPAHSATNPPVKAEAAGGS